MKLCHIGQKLISSEAVRAVMLAEAEYWGAAISYRMHDEKQRCHEASGLALAKGC